MKITIVNDEPDRFVAYYKEYLIIAQGNSELDVLKRLLRAKKNWKVKVGWKILKAKE